ncbi:DEAD/DEAH box helicase [Streptomyces sp. NPDC000349]|uniref:DEAD/DEAH box helicase n=1 Tax=unclassified Streptomyces TaxID=2593676 RepID=UPI002784AF75|nr:DEAD/DEAH box helicase [Streptomyces sp. DSM 40167]MDQ0406185.1 superfamily II DNA/RNA helicase [Streptomyces sp. DSM 40167]
MTLPVALSGTDVIGQAKTGTGKTLGFGLPLLERVTVPADIEAGRAAPEALTDAPQALVVVPTRELCQQVTNDLLTAGKVRNVRVTAIYGGRAYEPQVEALKKGVDVIVGTPGRLLDLAGQKKLSLAHVKCLVLDEADEMLDLGFLPDVEKIINMLPTRRQTMLFSATMPGAVIGLARRYMSQPTHISATSPDDAGATVANTKQFIYRAHNMDKPEMVARILQADGRGLAMVFCRTKRTAADLADQLKQRGFASGAVHGDLGQGAREQALRAFRNGKVDVLVCTDVAARGIDVEGVTHVINYQSPEEEKTYLHRIGRTGRAGAKGTAITLVDWDDIPRWQLIDKALDLGFNDPPETYSTSPHLYTDLGIPEGIKGVLPRSERTRAGLDAEVLEDLGEPGGRGGRTRGGRGGRDESRSAERERSSRETPRRRRRMRGGAPVDADTSASAAAEAVTGGADGATGTDEAGAPRTLRRRRRTRGGEPSRRPVQAATADAPVAQAAEDSAVAVSEVTDVAQAAEVVETPAKPRRRRTRKSAEAPAAPLETTPATEPAATATAVVEAPVVEAPVETKPRRTRKTAAPKAEPAAKAEAVATKAEAVADTVEGTETKPRRRTRKAATAEPVEATEATQAPETAEAKPRRTRKTAAAKAEAVADTAEGTEAKPRRRTRKATQAAGDSAEATEATAGIPAQTAPETEAVEAKPRRTRKTTAAKAEAVADTAEGTETKPRRRTRKAATAEPVEATEEAVEAKPRRTRKTTAAKAEAVADTAEGTEAKPRRRTRKATQAAEPAEATAGIPAQAVEAPDEAKPKARRTRKAAAAATQPAESGES